MPSFSTFLYMGCSEFSVADEFHVYADLSQALLPSDPLTVRGLKNKRGIAVANGNGQKLPIVSVELISVRQSIEVVFVGGFALYRHPSNSFRVILMGHQPLQKKARRRWFPFKGRKVSLILAKDLVSLVDVDVPTRSSLTKAIATLRPTANGYVRCKAACGQQHVGVNDKVPHRDTLGGRGCESALRRASASIRATTSSMSSPKNSSGQLKMFPKMSSLSGWRRAAPAALFTK
jgi:hypothetical protein